VVVVYLYPVYTIERSKCRADIKQTSSTTSRPDGTPPLAQM